jgi:hypothetical protein
MAPPIPTFADLLTTCAHDAIHLESRDAYSTKDEAFQEWRREHTLSASDALRRWGSWIDLAGTAAARGVNLRRVRVVSEPLSDYTCYEYDITDTLNIAAGEQVRWLPRDRAPHTLTVPINDYWVFDAHTALILHHDGDGDETGRLVSHDRDVITTLRAGFDLIWDAATDHRDYQPRRP